MKKYTILSQKPVGLAGISVLMVCFSPSATLTPSHKSLSAWQAFLSEEYHEEVP